MWMWEKTHYLISDYLRWVQQNQLSEAFLMQLKEEITNEIREEFMHSKQKDYTKLDYQEKGGLSEHFYGENIDDQLEPTIEKVISNLTNFIASEWGEKVVDLIKNHHAVYIENPKKPDFEAMKVLTEVLDGLKNVNIMANPDFWVVLWDKKFILLDWKTGKQPLDPLGITDQLKVYALKLLLKSKKEAKLDDYQILAYEVYLPSLAVYGWEVQEQDIVDILNKIEQDVNFQKKFLVNEDPLLNQPVESSLFSRTHSLAKCEHCTFRKVCQTLAELKK